MVGLLVRPHGVRGEIAAELLGDNPERLRPGSELLAVHGDAGVLSPAAARRLRVVTSRPHRGRRLLTFVGIDDRDRAEELRGHYLAVPRSAVPPPPPGSYYHFQLVGCRCRDAEAGELGTVTGVLEDGGGELLVIERDGCELLVPFVRSFLRSVDVDAGEIELELPPGLIATCTSTS